MVWYNYEGGVRGKGVERGAWRRITNSHRKKPIKTGLHFLIMIHRNEDGSDWSRCPPNRCGIGSSI